MRPSHAPMGQWPQIMVTTDANKMHQNVAFSGIKFHNFLGKGHSLPTPHRSVFEEFSRFNRRLTFV